MICDIVKNLFIKFRFLTKNFLYYILYNINILYYVLLNIIFENNFSSIISCYFLLLIFKLESLNIAQFMKSIASVIQYRMEFE